MRVGLFDHLLFALSGISTFIAAVAVYAATESERLVLLVLLTWALGYLSGVVRAVVRTSPYRPAPVPKEDPCSSSSP